MLIYVPSDVQGRRSHQNTETAHTKDNQYNQRFGSLRGSTKQKAKMRKNLFDGAPFIQQEELNAINNGTKRGKCGPQTREDDGVQTTFDDNVEDVQEPLGADFNKLENI